MIVSLITGRKNSKGFPNKHFCKVGGKFLSYYPMRAAINCKHINVNYLSTDDERLESMAKENNIKIIKRPPYLSSDEALSEDVFIHGYDIIKKNHKDKQIDMIVILMCNAATITSDIISKGIEILQKNPDYDSAVTVSRYNMWSPIRARTIGEDNLLHPAVSFDLLGNSNKFNCDRNSQGDIWFADMGVSIVRPRCIDNLKHGLLPQKWMGQKIYPLKQEMGLDVDYEWQIYQVQRWLEIYGEND